MHTGAGPRAVQVAAIGPTRFRITTDLGEATRACDAIFIAVGTPQSETGDADLSYVEAVACEIARSLTTYKVIVEKSTVPVYTNEWIRRSIERKARRGWRRRSTERAPASSPPPRAGWASP